jgi:hypothetical protein
MRRSLRDGSEKRGGHGGSTASLNPKKAVSNQGDFANEVRLLRGMEL